MFLVIFDAEFEGHCVDNETRIFENLDDARAYAQTQNSKLAYSSVFRIYQFGKDGAPTMHNQFTSQPLEF